MAENPETGLIRRVRIVTVPGTHRYVQVFDADTGEKIPSCMRIRFEMDCCNQGDCLPRATINNVFTVPAVLDVEVDVLMRFWEETLPFYGAESRCQRQLSPDQIKQGSDSRRRPRFEYYRENR